MYLFLILAPICLCLFFFAKQIIRIWLGPDFVATSAVVFQILTVGVFVNCFAHVPYCFLQGLGRPDKTAKLFFAELIPYACFSWWMISHEGIVGAATAWSVRAAIETMILMIMAWQTCYLSPRWLLDRGMLRGLLALCGLGSAMIATKTALPNSLVLEVSLTVIWLAGFGLVVWKYVFDDSDQGSLMNLFDPLCNALKNRGSA
jgi:O-antigen/teichoic acid export membrane protein